MATLSKKQKVLIVERLAMFDTPSEVVEAVQKEFEIEVTRSQVQYYDPTKAYGKAKLAKKWKDLFFETRQRFKEEVESIAIANKAYRLRRLQQMAGRARRAGNLPLAADLMEQAAKDVGEYYTNKKILTGEGGGPIETKNINVEVGAEEYQDMTTSEKAMLYRERIHNGQSNGKA